jgi:tRNA-splicing ligase RtcB
MSREGAKKQSRGVNIEQMLAEQGILVRAASRGTLAEEAPYAYKDVSDVVDAC